MTLLSDSFLPVSEKYSLPTEYALQVIVPPYYYQSPYYLDWIEIVSGTAQGLSTATFIGIAVSQAFFDMSAELFWGIINFNQLVFFTPLMGLKLHPLLFMLFKILRFSVGDLYYLQQLYKLILGNVLNNFSDHPFSENFQSHEFPSMQLLATNGPMIMVFVFQLFLLSLLLLKKIKRFQRILCMRKFLMVLSCLKWNSFIRTLLQIFMEIYLFSILNIFQFLNDANSTFINFSAADYLSTTLSFIFLLALVMFPFGIIRVLARKPRELEFKKSKTYKSYGQLYRDQRFDKSFYAKHYKFFFLFRRFALVVIIARGQRSPIMQLLIAILLCIFQIWLLVSTRTFKIKCDTIIVTITQCALLLIYFFFLGIHLSNGKSVILIWMIAGVVAITNICVFTAIFIYKVIDCHKQRKRKKKLRELEKMRSTSTSLRSFQLRSLNNSISQIIVPQVKDELPKSTFKVEYEAKESKSREVKVNFK